MVIFLLGWGFFYTLQSWGMLQHRRLSRSQPAQGMLSPAAGAAPEGSRGSALLGGSGGRAVAVLPSRALAGLLSLAQPAQKGVCSQLLCLLLAPARGSHAPTWDKGWGFPALLILPVLEQSQPSP